MDEVLESLELEFSRVLSAAASSSTRCVTVQVAASGDEGDTDEDTERGDAVEVLQPLGLLSVPTVTATTQAPYMRVGDQLVATGIIDKGATAQAVETGGTKLYGAGSGNAAAVVYIRASGAIEVTAKSNVNVVITAGGTGLVVLQNGSQAFIRGNDYSSALTTFVNADNVFLSALATAFGAISAYATAIQPIADPTNTATPVLTAALGTVVGAITTRVNAGTAFANSSVAWLSTRVFGQ
jgi:hypothetical protein